MFCGFRCGFIPLNSLEKRMTKYLVGIPGHKKKNVHDFWACCECDRLFSTFVFSIFYILYGGPSDICRCKVYFYFSQALTKRWEILFRSITFKNICLSLNHLNHIDSPLSIWFNGEIIDLNLPQKMSQGIYFCSITDPKFFGAGNGQKFLSSSLIA